MANNNLTKKAVEIKDRKVILSTLWVFVMFNYLYCDVMSLMDPKLLKQYISGNPGGVQVTEGFLFWAAILMEIPIAMVLLSRVLKNRLNRWTNIIAGIIMTVVQLLALIFGTSPTFYYLFFSIIEIGCTSFIVWYAWKKADFN
jgi:hypothetical protein